MILENPSTLERCKNFSKSIKKYTNKNTRQSEGNTCKACRASRKAKINNFLCLFSKRHNTDTHVDVKEVRGNDVSNVNSYVVSYLFKRHIRPDMASSSRQ